MPGAGTGADAASILGEGDVADVVEPVLDAPMVPGEAQQALRRGRLGRQAGDEVDDLGAGLAGDLAPALDAGHLGEARPGQIGDDLAADRDLAGLDAAVALLHRLGPGDIGPRLLTGGKRRRRRWRCRDAAPAGSSSRRQVVALSVTHMAADLALGEDRIAG